MGGSSENTPLDPQTWDDWLPNGGGQSVIQQGGGVVHTKEGLTQKINKDDTLDFEAKNNLLGLLDQGTDPSKVFEKYQKILDPQNELGKQLLYRKESADRIKNRPGLSEQTFFGDAVPGNPGGFFR